MTTIRLIDFLKLAPLVLAAALIGCDNAADDATDPTVGDPIGADTTAPGGAMDAPGGAMDAPSFGDPVETIEPADELSNDTPISVEPAEPVEVEPATP